MARDFLVRLTNRVACALGLAEPPLKIIIFGMHSDDWMQALGPHAPVWQRVGNVDEVLSISENDTASMPKPQKGVRTIVQPLMETHMLACPRHQHEGMIPSFQALATLDDKAAFATYVVDHQLTTFCPAAYASAEEAQFPCVLKRCDLNGGWGVEVVDSRQQLESLLAVSPWQGHDVVLQSYESSRVEIVTHIVCVDGRVIWHTSFMHMLPEGERVRRWSTKVKTVPYHPTSEVVRTIERFLKPLHFNGPCNVNYVVRDDGSVCVFEFNPRLGGSLMYPAHVDILAEMLRAIFRYARPLADTLCLETQSSRAPAT